MICKNCKTEMHVEEVLTCRTTSPEQDDTFENMWVCDTCDECEPIINEPDEMEEDNE
jgi:RNase P subunit RPR2